jgi:hypothetical protein
MSDTERESRVGSQIGPYRLRRLLGKGAWARSTRPRTPSKIASSR